MPDIVDKFTSHLKSALTRALVAAVEEGEVFVAPKHLLWALATQKGCLAAEVLHKHKVKLPSVRKLVSHGAAKDISGEAKTPPLSENAKRMVEKAVLIAHLYNHRYVGTEHLLAAIMQIPDEGLAAFFTQEQISVPSIREQLVAVFRSTNRFPEVEEILSEQKRTQEGMTVTEAEGAPKEQAEAEKSKTPALDYFSRALSDPPIAATLDPVIGREAEIDRVMEILCRRTKNNPLLLGDAGVGKTAIVEGLAKRIAEGRVPTPLMHKRILSLDLGSVVAGTIYRGEFEGRMKQILDEVRAEPNIILFIDEIHTMIGAGSASGSLDAANLLKPALSRGELRCIGATTVGEYKKHLETDAALERRFQVVRVEEPSKEDTLLILRGLVGTYERHHHVRIPDDVLVGIVTLSDRYLSDRHFPDKAIDVLDEAAAMLRVHGGEPVHNGSELRKRENELKEARARKRQAVVEELYEEAHMWKKQEEALEAHVKTIATTEQEPECYGIVDLSHVASVISKSTGVPTDELLAVERERLKNLPTLLAKSVIGQPHVTDAVARTIARVKAGVRSPRRPMASFLFVGPSGVGKTELARVLAKTVLQDTHGLIAFDMSEYAEGFAISKLIGSPAGYVGYREGAKLTDLVKQKPHAVILFDELEKAHRDVQNLLLQILEEGSLTDATGRRISFEHAIVVGTTNAGWEQFRGGSIGFASGGGGAMALSDIRPKLEEVFRPELLNRLDAIHVFQPLTVESLTQIATLHLEELAARLLTRGITLTYADDVSSHLGKRAEGHPSQGRSIRQLLQETLEDPLAEKLLANETTRAYHAKCAKDSLVVVAKR